MHLNMPHWNPSPFSMDRRPFCGHNYRWKWLRLNRWWKMQTQKVAHDNEC